MFTPKQTVLNRLQHGEGNKIYLATQKLGVIKVKITLKLKL